MQSRFRTFDEHLEDFAGTVLVACPRCGDSALVRVRERGSSPGVVLACSHCGLSRGWAPRRPGVLRTRNPARFPGYVVFGPAVDPYFRLPLWLQTRCRGNVLWAYNEAHLQWLEGYVGAALRERSPGEHGWSNQSMASRLPRWMQAARNREEVLRCIRTLRERT